jgi:hypothetical protein
MSGFAGSDQRSTAQHGISGEVLLVEMLPGRSNGEEPPPEVAMLMARFDVVLCPTSKSLTFCLLPFPFSLFPFPSPSPQPRSPITDHGTTSSSHGSPMRMDKAMSGLRPSRRMLCGTPRGTRAKKPGVTFVS